MILAVLILSPLLVGLYLPSDSALKQAATFGLRIVVFGSMPYSMQLLYRNYLQDISRHKEVVLMTVLSELVLPLGCVLVLTMFFVVSGFWFAFVLQEILSLLVLLTLIRRNQSSCKYFTGDAILMLPADFGAKPENRLSCRIRNSEDVVLFSKHAQQFCLFHQAGMRCATIIALCVEEIGINILHFGMGQHEKECEILLYLSNNIWTLRFRDDCDAFDPVSYLHSMTKKDLTERFGLRLTLTMAGEAVYVRSMNINNLRIRIDPSAVYH